MKPKYFVGLRISLIALLGGITAHATPPDWINVKDAPYNAQGNGTADDTNAIQAAFNAADAAKVSGGTGPAVFFPKGIYKISNTLTWKAHSIIGSDMNAVFIDWAGVTTGTTAAVTSATLALKKMENISFRNGTPPVWVHVTGVTNPGGQFLRCAFGKPSGTGGAAIRLGQVNVGHFENLRFTTPQPYAIEILQGGGAMRSFRLDGMRVNFTGHTAAKGFIRYAPTNTGGSLHIKLVNGRLNSGTALLTPGALVSVEGNYGIIPAYIHMDSLSMNISSLKALVHQSIDGNANAASQVVFENLKVIGAAAALSGTWNPVIGALPPIPTEGQIMFWSSGRQISGATDRNLAHFQQLAIGGTNSTPIRNHYSAAEAWDPPSLVDGAQTSTTIAVTGAALGDTAVVGFTPAVPGGMILTGSVTSANTVTVTLFNKSGTTRNLAAGTLRADVWKH